MLPNNAKQLSLVILTLVVFVLTVTESALGASYSMVSQELMQKATREGVVRVIVRLAVNENVVSPFDGDILGALRRANITQAQNSIRAALPGAAHRVHHQYRHLPFIALQLSSHGLKTLDSLNGVVSEVLEDKLVPTSLAESVPLVQADQVWMGAFKGAPYDGSGTVVAILDTGVDKNHPFLGNVIEEACFSSNYAADGATSFCPGGAESSFAPGSGLPCDSAISRCYHGTHVAGIATGNGRNGTVAWFSGVAKGANVMAVQVFSRFDNPIICGSSAPCILAYTSDIMAGLERVYDLRSSYNFASINLSLGAGGFTTFCDNDPAKPIIDLLRAANIATVIAAGNGAFTDKISAPACISSAVSVGSTEDGTPGTTVDTVSSFSNSATFLSLLAPGRWIDSSMLLNGFANLAGTSMATPHVAGAFALIKQALPTLTVGQALTALQNSGLGVLDTRNNITKPRIRVLNALLSLDATPPDTTITGSPLPLTNLTSANFTFASTMAGSFVCKLDAGAFASCPSPKSYSGLAAGSHTFQVRATDQSGNTDPTPASFTWVIDLSAPDTSITSSPPATSNIDNAAFQFASTEANSTFECKLDAAGFAVCASPHHLTGLANGSHTFQVRAIDGAGNADPTPASRTFTVTVPAATPTIALSFDGLLRDRVGQGELALGPDGKLDGVFTVTLSAGSLGRTVTRLYLTNTAGGIWDTQAPDGFWSLGAASGLDTALLNAANDAVNFAVSDGGSFKIFAAEYQDRMYLNGAVFTLTADFADGSSASATAAINGAPAGNPTISITYDGQSADRVGQAEFALGPDGKLDGVFTVTLNPGSGNRTITRLYLTNTPGGAWNTQGGDGFWSLGAASGVADPLLNGGTDAVSFALSEGSGFKIFAADWQNLMFIDGVGFNLTVNFSDGSSASANATVSSLAPAVLSLSYDGRLRDRVGEGELGAGQIPDGKLDGTFTVRLNAGSGNRTITRLDLINNLGGIWDTVGGDSYWLVGAALGLDSGLLNAGNDTVNFTVPEGGSFEIFVPDWQNLMFAPGVQYTLTARLSDGTLASASATIP